MPLTLILIRIFVTVITLKTHPLCSSTGLVVGMTQKKVPLRVIMGTASLLTWLGIVASSFAPSIAWMSVTLGIVYGEEVCRGVKF